jgi:hypothetical protein
MLAGAVRDDVGWAIAVVGVAVAPGEHGGDDGVQVAALLGESVLASFTGAVVAEHLAGDELVEAFGEHVGGDAEALAELVEVSQPTEAVSEDQQGPAIADDVEGSGDRTTLAEGAVHRTDASACRTPPTCHCRPTYTMSAKGHSSCILQLESATVLVVIELTASEGAATGWPRRAEERNAQTSEMWSAIRELGCEFTELDDARVARTLQDQQ